VDITALIPQREPFLFVNEILSIDSESIQTNFIFTEDMDFFKGHFPGNPIGPGVLLNEHCFQSGAALISHNSSGDFKNQLAVVSRISSAKFKNIVRPNEKIETTTSLIEQISNAAYFKSIVKNTDGKKILILEFACTLVESE
jgi:3-hydroxyacyl-[acyl-carrier-protein] dehydratase